MKKFIIIAHMKKVTIHRKRHIAKAITWRIVGTLDTWLISWLLITYIGEIGLFNIELNKNIIEEDMNNSLKIMKKEHIQKKNGSRKKRQELSLSATRGLSKVNIPIQLDFN